MSPAIVDSEDDDDEILAPDDRGCSRDTSSAAGNHTTPPKSQAGEQRSDSTDLLMQQLQTAAKDIQDNTSAPLPLSDMNATAAASGPLAQPEAMRRHNTELIYSRTEPPERALKRARTTRDLDYARLSTSQTTCAQFATLLHSDTEKTTSTSSISLNGSPTRPEPPGTLTSESIGQGFRDHEPAIMFRDTGSTIPDNESTQQRWLEQAVADRQGSNAGLAVSSADSAVVQSSSFPWSASLHPTPLGPGKPDDLTGGLSHSDDQIDMFETCTEITNEMNQSVDRTSSNTEHNGDSDNIQVMMPPPAVSDTQPNGSPEVRIPRNQIPAADLVKVTDNSSPGKSRDRRRKGNEEAAKETNSDDPNIGLPKELYNPRPSRRRATFMVEDQVDFSAVPEKVARKRRKTAHDENTANVQDASADGALQLDPLMSGKKQAQNLKSGQNRHEHEKDDRKDVGSEVENATLETEHVSRDAVDDHTVKDSTDTKNDRAPQDRQESVTIQLPLKASGSSTKRSRRHHTTIFEDHIDFVGSERSPSLKQQQAKRKSALADVRNESVRSSQRTRRSIIVDDDAEDELAGGQKLINQSPKKRGRKRKTQDPVMEKVDTDVGPQKEVDSESTDFQNQKDDRNVRQAHESDSDTAGKQLLPHKTHQDKDTAGAPVAETTGLDDNGDVRPTTANAAPASNPALDKPAPQPPSNATSAPQGSPTSHSPIKSLSKVPLRVGLSKHQRIPSLLRVVRPLKR